MIYIGIPTLNTNRWLRQTLASIWTSHPYKIYIGNNGDNPIPKAFHNLYPIEEEHYGRPIGLAKTWNKMLNWALSHEDCEAIFLINDDIEFYNNTVDLMYDALMTKFDLTGAVERRATQPRFRQERIKYVPKRKLKYHPNPEPRYGQLVCFSCFALTPKCVDIVGMFDENFPNMYGEDSDYMYRAKLAGVSVGTDRRAQFKHYMARPRGSAKRKGSGGMTVHNMREKNRRYFKRKHGILPSEVVGRLKELGLLE